jgi:predicted AlkP superfamily pyrophosphatase or phosphodiesterase
VATKIVIPIKLMINYFIPKPLLSLISVLLAVITIQAQPSGKVVFIIVDGIPADVIEKVPTPYLDSIAANGGYARAMAGGGLNDYTTTPTISAVGYNSLITGTWVNKHNVWDNDIVAPNYHYPSIFRLFKDQYPSKKIAVFSSWEDNRTKLVGELLPSTRKIKTDYSFDGLENDTVNYPHDKDRDFMLRIDEAVTAKAAATIRNAAPDLSWVYLEYTDDMGHKFGDSEQFIRAVKLMDIQVGKIYSAVRERESKYHEKWQIYITTDHGRDAISGRGHGGQTPRERSTWIVTNAGNLNERFKAGRAAITDIMPSMARFLNISIPDDVNREIDGVPITGKISGDQLAVVRKEDSLLISWNVINPEGEATILFTRTNDFANGKKDRYQQALRVPVSRGRATIPFAINDTRMFKIVAEMPFNTLNRWYVPDEKMKGH